MISSQTTRTTTPSVSLLPPAVEVSAMAQRDPVIESVTNLSTEQPTTSTRAAAHAEVGPAITTPEETTPAAKKNLPLIQRKLQWLSLEEEVIKSYNVFLPKAHCLMFSQEDQNVMFSQEDESEGPQLMRRPRTPVLPPTNPQLVVKTAGQVNPPAVEVSAGHEIGASCRTSK